MLESELRDKDNELYFTKVGWGWVSGWVEGVQIVFLPPVSYHVFTPSVPSSLSFGEVAAYQRNGFSPPCHR